MNKKVNIIQGGFCYEKSLRLGAQSLIVTRSTHYTLYMTQKTHHRSLIDGVLITNLVRYKLSE